MEGWSFDVWWHHIAWYNILMCGNTISLCCTNAFLMCGTTLPWSGVNVCTTSLVCLAGRAEYMQYTLYSVQRTETGKTFNSVKYLVWYIVLLV